MARLRHIDIFLYTLSLANRDRKLMVTLPYIDRDRKLTVTLPYIRGVSESLKRMLEEVDVRVRMKPHRTLRQILVKPIRTRY